MRFWGLILLLVACDQTTPGPIGVRRVIAPDAGSAGAAGLDSGAPDAPLDSPSPIPDAAPDVLVDSPADAPSDAPAEASPDAGWYPPDGASSNAQLGARCDGAGDPCTGMYPAWSETGGRYYLLSCELGPDAISSLCTFECDDGRGYEDRAKAADCIALGGTCELGGAGAALYCIK